MSDPSRNDSEVETLRQQKEHYRQEIRRLREALEQRELELSKERRRSEEALLAKSQFLANMSHELRTPMNSIIGFAEILSDKAAMHLEPRYKKFLGNILHSGRHLLALINDVLDLSRIEAGQLDLAFERVSIYDVARGVRGVLVGMAIPRGIEIRLQIADDLPPIVADAPKLKQILYNLLANGIKFSHDRSEVVLGARRLAADLSPSGEEAVEVYVTDHGIGIEPEHQESIFAEFHQIDGNANREHPGAGLGLALVKRFTEMHGGQVTLESAPGEGSTFRVFLPLDASQVILTPGSGPDELPEVGLTKSQQPLILVVEDDDTFFTALASDLEASGYAVERARHGEEALDLIDRLRPRAITLDLALPGMDGWQVLKALKKNPATASLPVVIVSLVENHELGFALGADDYFLKPLERRPFLERLQILMVGSQQPSTVLVIDDDTAIHDLLADDLEASGYRRLSAFDGEQGLQMALTERPAVIVLDLMMPGMSGFEVAARLRADARTSSIPIVVLTSKDLTGDDRRLLQGVEGLLSKTPINRQAILETLRRLDSVEDS